jgi:hypothetical protein
MNHPEFHGETEIEFAASDFDARYLAHNVLDVGIRF